MSIEIERKFLVDASKISLLNLSNGVKIIQGYLSVDPHRTVRVRLNGEQGFITIKSLNNGISRQEFEYKIPREDTKEILKLCEPRILVKIRYNFYYIEHKWEIDIFEGKLEGLILAEVELDSTDELIKIPKWTLKEVSNDPRYFNSNLLDNFY